MPNYSPLVIANAFIQKGIDAGTCLTQMKVQKLVYIAHGWHLRYTNGQPLISESYEAWQFGPVNRKLYNALSRYGNRKIDNLIHWGQDTPFLSDDGSVAEKHLDDIASAIIDMVWDVYGAYPAFKLSALTHEVGTPWSNTFEAGENNPIPNADITEHFNQLAA